MSDLKMCPTCGTEYPLSERFCPRDGTALRAPSARGDLVGSVIAERYHVLKKLGEGGMGTVYLAEHVKMGRKAALKVMNPGMSQTPDAVARFNREATNASRLNHPNICGIYDFGETRDGMIYLAMEFIEGVSLTSLIETNGALAAPRAALIIHQAADALQVAHDYGIVHRDLKPENIMVARGRDGSDNVKVVDFGIAKASSSDAQKVTKTGLVVGTPEYMSPEQLSGDKLDGRSDIYSLGLVAFNCLTGKLPFPSDSARETMIMRLTDKPRTLAEMKADVAWPAELQAVMDRALARDAGDRYQSAAEFGRDIAKAVGGMPEAVAATARTQVIGAARRAAIPKTRVAPATSKPPMLVAVGAVAVLALAMAGYFALKGGGSETQRSGAAAQQPAGGTAVADARQPKKEADKSSTSSTPPVGFGRKEESKAPTRGAAPATASVKGVIARLSKVAESSDPTELRRSAPTALRDIEEALRLAQGVERGDLYYLQAMFLDALERRSDACAAARRAVREPASAPNASVAQEFLKQC